MKTDAMKTDAKVPTTDARSHVVDVDGQKIHFLMAGEKHAKEEVTLLLHGWPTSSYLWRRVIPALARHTRVLAPDLPGFGQSDKPLQATYSFRFFGEFIDGFLASQGAERVNLVVHDLGGPVGLHWAVRHPEKISRLALLNTLVYPEISWAVKLFILFLEAPGIRSWISSPAGIRWALRFGVDNKSALTDEVLRPYLDPFQEKPARLALLKTGRGLSPKGFHEIARKLPRCEFPVRLIYGEKDRILPDVAKTMARVQKDLPQAILTSLPNCAHFLQEDDGDQVGELLVEFLLNSTPERQA